LNQREIQPEMLTIYVKKFTTYSALELATTDQKLDQTFTMNLINIL